MCQVIIVQLLGDRDESQLRSREQSVWRALAGIQRIVARDPTSTERTRQQDPNHKELTGRMGDEV